MDIVALQSFGEETEDSFRHEGEASFRSIDRSLSSKSSRGKSMEKLEIKKEDEQVRTDSDTIKESQRNQQIDSDPSKRSVSRQSTCSTKSESMQCYPDVPGFVLSFLVYLFLVR